MGEEESKLDPIREAWEVYHGPVDFGDGEDCIPPPPPAFTRGFVDGYEHSKKEFLASKSSAEVEVWEAGDEYGVLLKVGVQSFALDYFVETHEEAEWMRGQLVSALSRIQSN